MQHQRKMISVQEALACFERISPVAPKRILLTEAIGLHAVESNIVRRPFPEFDRAAEDGWAVVSSKLGKASRRRPSFLTEPSKRIDKGDLIPSGFDAVLPNEDVVFLKGKPASITSVMPGHAIERAGSFFQEGDVLLKAGMKINLNSATHGALCGIGHILVRRPVVDIICNSRDPFARDDLLVPVVSLAIRGYKAIVGAISFSGGDAEELGNLVKASSADVIVTVGGTGNGPGDTTLDGLSEVSELVFHGVRMNPGHSVAFSMAGLRPILSVPGNHLDILAVNAILGPSLAARVFGTPQDPGTEFKARLLNHLPGGKDGAAIYAGKRQNDQIEILGHSSLSSGNTADADCVAIVMEGDRHKRAGEQVLCLTL